MRALDEETTSASIPSRPLSKTQRLQLLKENKRRRLAQLTEARKTRPDSELTVLQDPYMAEAITMARRHVPFKHFEKAEEDTINALQQIIDNPTGAVPNASGAHFPASVVFPFADHRRDNVNPSV